MDPLHGRGLGTQQRGRLIVALVILSALAALCAVGIGEALHGWFETHDSLDHWKARLEEESGNPEAPSYATGLDSPAARIRRLEAELDAVPERLFAMGSMFLFLSVLVGLGIRKLRTDHRNR